MFYCTRSELVACFILMFHARFTRHLTNLCPAEKFDRILGSHGTVQYFHSVHTELLSARHLKVPCERNT